MPIHTRALPATTDNRSRLVDIVAADPCALGARPMSLPAGSSLLVEPNDDASVLVLGSGEASVTMPTLRGTDVFVTDLVAGEIVGEGAALDGDALALTLSARRDASVWLLARGRFRRRLGEDPEFATAVMDAMCRRLCRATLRLAETVAMSTRERIHAELLRLATVVEGTALAVPRAVTHEELASRAGTQREAVTKELSRLRRLGVVDAGHHTLRIRHPDRLRNPAF
jgi:CRP-like cAMP-binding protein